MAGSGTAHLHDTDEVVLRVEHLVVEYPHGLGEKVHAVSDVSFDVQQGETLGIVGESGCGKSTLARAIMQLVRVKSGSVVVGGDDLTKLKGRKLRAARLMVQMIFQDPISSLNPRRKVRSIVGEGLGVARRAGKQGNGSAGAEITANGASERSSSPNGTAPNGTAPNGTAPNAKRDRGAGKINEALEAVGLDPEVVGNRRPREFSGGQCQRVCIARALVMEPEIVICDEPVSALDVSVQAQILNLLEAMKARYGLTMVFIAHDLAVVKNISDRIAVMYLGKICEVGPSDELYARPLHPYTLGLLEAIPEADPDAVVVAHELAGDAPSPIHPPSGCRFRTRCPRATERCRDEEPEIRELVPGHFVACHHPLAAAGEAGE